MENVCNRAIKKRQKMTKSNILLILSVLWYFLSGCSKSDTESESNGMEIYFNDKKLAVQDSISTRLLSTFVIQIESTHDSVLVFSQNDNIELTQSAHNTYTCTTKTTGKDNIIFYPIDDILSTRQLRVTVAGYSDRFLILDNAYTVSVPSSTVTEYEILDELKNSYIPSKLSILSFQYATTNKGDFVYYKYIDKKDSITGTFNLDTSSNYTIAYPGKQQVINVSEKDGKYILTQNLKAIFQEKYPAQKVDSAMTVSMASKTTSK